MACMANLMIKKELESALKEEQSHLKTANNDFNALQLLKGNKAEFSNVEKLCDVNFAEPSVPIDVATSIMTGLSSVNSSKTLKATEKLAKDYENHVEQLKTLLTQLNEYNRTINGNATEAVKSAEEIEKNAKKAKKDAVETVIGEVRNKAQESCTAAKKIKSFSCQIEKNTEQAKNMSVEISLVSAQLGESVNDATETEKSCQKSSGVVEGAKQYVHAAADVELMHATNATCMSVIASVIDKSKEVVNVIGSVNKTMQNAENARKNANALLNEESTRLEAAKSNFTEMLKIIGVVSSEPVNVCDTDHFKSITPAFENLKTAARQLRSIKTISVEDVNKSVEKYAALIANASAGADTATVRSREAQENVVSSTKFVTEADKVARSVQKQALAKQKKRLCNTTAKLKDVNRNATALRDHASSVKTDATEHWRRATAAGRRAEDAVAHAVAAEVHAGKVAEEHQLTTEAVKKTKVEVRHAMKSRAVALREAEEHLNKINSSFEGALKNVPNGTCNIVVNVCSTATDDRAIVSEAEESLRTIEGIDALIESQLKAANEHASAAENAAAEAHAAAKNAQCTPLYIQLLHAFGNLLSV
ncbi:hypothetical protein TRVL_09488 [Trypanosoma vivax]|nr:hypothetical protein TRVL_09488 [Trypanosoma vivax]